MATPSRASLAKLYSELAPVPEHIALATLNNWTDEQVAALANSISAVLTPDEVFSAGAMAQLATDRADVYNATEAVVYAATLTPVEVFTGAPGTAKLVAWATGAGWTHA